MDGRARARDLGIAPGRFQPGRFNAITDVAGVRVGHTTLIEGADIRTGVTAVVPAQLVERSTLPAGLFVGNGYGKLIGATQLVELGAVETPIVLTGTLSAFRAADALVSYMLAAPGNSRLQSVNPVVGETNDGYLSDIRMRPVTENHVLSALHTAAGGPVPEGVTGAGTGTAALGFKAGIGTSSRVVQHDALPDPTHVGVLLQANFSGTLRVLGVPIEPGAALTDMPSGAAESTHPPGNSCMIVVATDAALDARQLGRLARRAVFGMARAGSDFAGGSGDYAIALSVGTGTTPAEVGLEPLFAAVGEPSRRQSSTRCSPPSPPAATRTTSGTPYRTGVPLHPRQHKAASDKPSLTNHPHPLTTVVRRKPLFSAPHPAAGPGAHR